VDVNLNEKYAILTSEVNLEDAIIKFTIEDEGYKVVSIDLL
jgi:hypothetical protein